MRRRNSALKLSLGARPAETILASKTPLLSHREEFFSVAGGERPLDARIKGEERSERGCVNWAKAGCWTSELKAPQKPRGPDIDSFGDGEGTGGV